MGIRIRLAVRTAFLLWIAVSCESALGATATFTGGAGTPFWNAPANWSTRIVPGINDNVIIKPANGITTIRLNITATVNSIDVQSGATFLIQAGCQLIANAASNVDAGGILQLNSSNFAGNGPLSVNGELDIYGGTIGAGSGALNVNGGGLLAFWGTVNSARVLRSINNAGTITFRNDIVAGNHFGVGGGIWNTGLIDIQTDHDVMVDAGTPVLSNNGTIRKSSGSGNASINFTVSNAGNGTIQSQSGTLTLGGGGTISGTHSISSGAKIALTGGTFTVVGSPTITGAGTLNVAGATVNIGDGPGGSSDGWTSSSPIIFTSGTIALKDANLSTSSTFAVSATVEHYGGSLTGSGSMTINSGGVIKCHGTDNHSNIAINTLVNSGGQIVYTNDIYNYNQYGLFANVTITNNGTIDFQTDRGLDNLGGAGDTSNIHNVTGTLKKSAGASATTIGVKFNADVASTIRADSGTLTFSKGGTLSGCTISGAGTVAVPAGYTVNGATVSGKLELTGNATVSLALNASGTLLLDSGVDVTWPTVNLSASTSKIDGAGTLRVSNLTWAGGTIAGSGGRIANGLASISCSAGNCTLDGATLQLQNGATFTASANPLVFSNAASLTIASGTTFSINNDGDVAQGSGTLGSITNSGTLRKQSTSGTSTIAVPLTMSGSAQTNVNAGTLQFSGGVTTGAQTFTIGGTALEVTGGVFLCNAAPAISGAGLFKVSGGTLRIPSGTVTIPSFTLSGGTVDGAGTLALSNGGTWSGGTMSGAGTTSNAAAKTLSITAPVTLDRTLQNDGILAVSGNVGGSGTIANAGTLNATASSTINPALNNSGSVKVTGGTLALAGGGTHTGSFTTTSPGTLAFSGGTHAMSGVGKTIGGTGTLSFSGAAATVGIPVSGVGTLNVSAGTATLNAASSAGAFTLSGGTLNGGGALTLTNGGTWSGGTMGGGGTTTNPLLKTLSVTAPVTLDRTLQNDGILTAGGNIGGSGAIAGGGLLSFSGGSATVGVAVTTGVLSVTGGTATLNGTTSAVTLAMSGGTLGGSGAINLTNGGTWSGGTMTGSGTTTNPATLSITAPVTLGRTLQNDGTLAVSADVGGSGVVQNAGTLNATASSTIAAALNNNGSVNVTAGTLALGGGGTHSGSFTTTSPGTLAFSFGTHAMSGAGKTIGGTGTLSFSGATATVGIPVSGVGTLNVSAGTATLNAASSANAFSMTGGTLGGSGLLTLGNGGTWSGGTMSGGGTTVNAATLVITAPVTLDRTLQNNGTLHVSGHVGGSGMIANTSVLDAAASSTIDPALDNGGSVTVTAGTLALAGGGTHTGSFTATSPGTLAFSGGTHTMSGAGKSIGGTGTLSFGGAAVTVGIPVSVGTLSVSGGTATLNGSSDAGAFAMTGGALNGTAALTLTNGGTWSGGTMGGGGTTVNPPAKTLSITAPVVLDRTLQNDGTLSVSGSISGSGTIVNNAALDIGGSAALTVALSTSGSVTTSAPLSLSGGGNYSGSFTINAPGSIAFTSGTFAIAGGGTISGNGTLSFSGASATVSIPVSVGALSVSGGIATLNGTSDAGGFTMTGGTLSGSGALTLTNGGTWSGGTMSGSGATTNPPAKTLAVTAPVTLDRVLQNDGTLTLGGNVGGGGAIHNAGTITAGGAAAIDAALDNNGQLTTTAALTLNAGGTHGGAFTITSPGSLTFANGTHSIAGSLGGTGTLSFAGATATVGVPITVGALNISNGTATLNAASSAGAFTMTAGTLGGSGTLTLTNGGSWSGGTMSGSGTTVNPASKTLSVAAVALNGRTLQNDGALSVNGDVTGSGTIDNNGTIDVNASATIGPALNNDGQLNTGAALVLGAGGTHTGSFAVTAPGSLTLSGGTHSMTGAGKKITGSGTLRFAGAAATVAIPIDNVGAIAVTAGTATLNADAAADGFTMSGGTLDGGGTLTLTNGGSWSGGAMSGGGATVNPLGKSVGITAPVTLARALQNNGTLNVSAGVAGSGGTIANNGTLNVLADSTIAAALSNHGQIATSSVLTLAGSGSHNGTFAISAPGAVDFRGGTHTFLGSFTGTGTVRFSGAAATVNGLWSGMPLEVSGGSVALNPNGATPSLTVSGGTLAGTGNITVAGPSTWSGGTIGGSGGLTFDTGAVVTIAGDELPTLQRALTNKGTIDVTQASSMAIDGVAVTNDGTFDVQAAQNILATPGTPPFANHGTLKKSGGGIAQFAVPLANAGTVQIGAGTWQFIGGYTQSAGATDVAAGATLQAALLLLNGGSLTGNGAVAGNLENHAVVAPGASPGVVTVNGDYTQGPDGQLDIQLGGTTAGTQYDQVNVTGTAYLDGTLNVTAINGFVPATGNAFQILTYGARSGAFSVTNGLNFAGTKLVPAYSSGNLTLNTINTVADLAASVSAPSSATNGSAFAYTVGVANGGPANATGVAFSAPLPPNVTFNSVTGANCTGAPNLLCTIGTLANGAIANVVLNVTAHSPGSAPLSISTAENESDPNSTNNTASASTTIHAVADLQIAISGPASTVPNTQPIYTVQVLNMGPDMANSVGVTATASPGLTFDSNGGACGSFPCNVGPLAAGQTATIQTRWNVDASAAGAVQLSVSAGSTTQDTNPLNNTASATTLIGACPTIVIEKAPAELITLSNASATATLYAGATYVWKIENGTIDTDDGAGRVTFTAGSPGITTLSVTVTAPGCALSATHVVTVKPPPACQGTASPTVPLNDTTTADATVAFGWTGVAGASGYRVWLQQPDTPSLDLGTTLGTSLTKVVPPGAYRWYVETLFDGCASHESERRTLTILGADDCNHETPRLTAPANDTATSNATVAFGWTEVPGALQYELWLAPAGGVPVLYRATSVTSEAATVEPGRWEWFVRVLFAGCPRFTESEHRAFTYVPPSDCRLNQRPLLLSPANRERQVTSPATFVWSKVAGATSFELYIDGVRQATATQPQARDVAVSLGEHRWRVRAYFAGNCAPLDSAESRFAVVPRPVSCAPLDAPVLAAPPQISSGVDFRFQWTYVPGATNYVVDISTDAHFAPASTTSTTVQDQQMPFRFTNETGAPVARYVRVRAEDAKCIPTTSGPFSAVAVVSVLPQDSTSAWVMLSDRADVESVLRIGPELEGQSFTATPTVPWLNVTPASGVVPHGGQVLHTVAHTAGLPPGTSVGGVTITTASVSSSTAKALASSSFTTRYDVKLAKVSTPDAGETPQNNALVIPLAMQVTTNDPLSKVLQRVQSSIRITNASLETQDYRLVYIPKGKTGMSKGFQTSLPIDAGATISIEDLWLKYPDQEQSGIGTLVISPPDPPEHAKATSDAPVEGLGDRVTFATAFTTEERDGVTFGRSIPAVPYANFASDGDVLMLQQLSQSKTRSTTLGLVEASGVAAEVEIAVFDAGGKEALKTFTVALNGGENAQIDDVLGQELADARIEVRVKAQNRGENALKPKVTAYALVVDKNSPDELFVPPARLSEKSKWILPGVADFSDGRQTDVRIFNGGDDTAALTLAFHGKDGSSAPKTFELAAGATLQLDRVLPSLFGIAGETGALHVASNANAPAKLLVSARTYTQSGDGGAYGQFIPAVTEVDAITAGSRSLQILQVEQSEQRSSTIGLAELSGKPVTVKVEVFLPEGETRALEVTLAANQYQQLDLLKDFNLANTYNARVGVSVVGGKGQVTAYLALTETRSGDATYFPGQ